MTQLRLLESSSPGDLVQAAAQAKVCTACRLHKTRLSVVFGSGNVDHPDLMFIGEGPGSKEDETGLPFVGKAGALLNVFLDEIGYNRDEVYIANVVKCRPPENRKPAQDEINACAHFLSRQIRAVSPKGIVLLGQTAAEALLEKEFKNVEGARQNWYTWGGIPVKVTYHPAYVLRNPQKKQEALTDLRLIVGKIKTYG